MGLVEIAKVITPLLAVTMAIIAYIKYRRFRYPDSKLEVTTEATAYPNGDDTIVTMTIKMSNKGNTIIKAVEDKCVLRLKKLPSATNNQFTFHHFEKLENLSSTPIKFLVEEYGPTDPQNPYLVEPGITDSVHVVFSTTFTGFIFAQVIFEDMNKYVWSCKRIFSTSL